MTSPIRKQLSQGGEVAEKAYKLLEEVFDAHGDDVEAIKDILGVNRASVFVLKKELRDWQEGR